VVSQYIGGDSKFGRLTVLDELVEERLATVGDSVDSQVSNPKVDLLRDAVAILGTAKPPLKFAERRRFPPVFHLEVLADLVHDVVPHPMITSQIAKDRVEARLILPVDPGSSLVQKADEGELMTFRRDGGEEEA